MFGKILLALLLIPIAYVLMIVIAGVLASLAGITIYYCIKYMMVGLVVLVVFLLVREYQKSKD